MKRRLYHVSVEYEKHNLRELFNWCYDTLGNNDTWDISRYADDDGSIEIITMRDVDWFEFEFEEDALAFKMICL